LTATFVGLLTPGLLLNVVSHVTTITGGGGDREAQMVAYVVCQLAACLGYSSPPLACLICDRSLLRQIVRALIAFGCYPRAAAATDDGTAAPSIVVTDSPADNEDDQIRHRTAVVIGNNNGYTVFCRGTLETPSVAEVTIDVELTSLNGTDIKETDV
jgi:hypothetical protein